MGKKYEKCVVKETKIVDEFAAHVPGKYQIMLDNEMVPEADFFVAAGIHQKIYQESPISYKHYHDQSEVYLFISKKGDAEIEVELDDETYRAETPCTIYVPKGVRHTYRYLRIDGPLTVAAIVRNGEYIPKK